MRERMDKSGSALVITLLFMAISAIAAASLLVSSMTQQGLIARQISRERALAVAEAGLERAAQQIADSRGYLGDVTAGSGTINGHRYGYAIFKIGKWSYRIAATGKVDNVKWSVAVDRADLPSWAKYALWMEENGVIYFTGGEEFNGWVHSNDKMWFSKAGGTGPIFRDHLTSAQSTYGGDTNGSTFAKGLVLNAEQGAMAETDFAEMQNLAAQFGTVLDGTTYIEFSGATMKVTNQRMGWKASSQPVGSNNVLYVRTATSGATSNRSGTAFVSGTVDGRITIVTEDDVMIKSHVRYATSPTNSACDDALGLVAKDDVSVDTTCPNNLDIHAAIMAAGQSDTGGRGSFGVINYNQGSPRGDLNVYGALF